MGQVKRIYVEKKDKFAGAASDLRAEIRSYLKIEGLRKVRILIRYDSENISPEVYEKAKTCVFSEPPVDLFYEEDFPKEPGDRVFAVEYLPGQFDQRADSAVQCVQFLGEKAEILIRTAVVYVLSGNLSEEEFLRIEEYCMNPVDSRIAPEGKADTLRQVYPEAPGIEIFQGFTSMEEEALRSLYRSLNLAMTFADFQFIRDFFRDQEHRDPTATEVRVLDTYWSDHCRHTTFSTELTHVEFEEGPWRKRIEETFQRYLLDRKEVYGDRKDKIVSLMDLATMGARKLKKDGILTDQEESDEINACSIIIPVEIDGKTEEWLLNFKNETHNHPTEIEPFGGAATCLGGAIRDPLSGRTYVYQAMRVTGAADPTRPMDETLKGKLPQKKLVSEAAHGYSSYGNQIGLATGYVKEIYHPNYVAKRMEIGAVLGAARRSDVRRDTSRPGDLIILLGGRTGRDGIGGATGSSKAHTEKSIEVCGAEVQKGNAPTERKLQRMFKRPEVSRLIRKCNDFGAGGVSVAIGELAEGLSINLDMVPKKYEGLDGTEIAISESQERMAVVIGPEDKEAFLAYAEEENLEATEVALVTEAPRLVMHWRGRTIVDIPRAFLDTNGAHQETQVLLEEPKREDNYFASKEISEEKVRDIWLSKLADLNGCSQKGLVEMFDSSIGAGTVLMPYGGQYQMTETQTMVSHLPVPAGKCRDVSMMAYGFDPYLSSWSPYHGAAFAVLESVAKIVSSGGDFRKIHFTFQEYFRRMNEDRSRWSPVLASLLGAYEAQMRLGLASIGGKDSMSGSFDDIDVPPTLVSFAVCMNKADRILSPELKKARSRLMLLPVRRDADDLPDFEEAKRQYARFFEDAAAGRVLSAYALNGNGLAYALSKMAFGSRMGFCLEDSLSAEDLFAPDFGSICVEVAEGTEGQLLADYQELGQVTGTDRFSWRGVSIPIEEAESAWTETLESVYHTRTEQSDEALSEDMPSKEEIPLYLGGCAVSTHKIGAPRVFIPVFPGTNCEMDSERAFLRAGALTDVKVFRNLRASAIEESVELFSKSIEEAQIIMFPGGFSAGDEPDGSAKFFATAFRNEKIRDAVTRLLEERDGLILGICNGFQALIKLGLVPYGKICGQTEDSPTLTFNTLHRHVSRMVYTKVMTNKSPWLLLTKPGEVYVNPASHGEGRFVGSREVISELIRNGQVATMYSSPSGEIDADIAWNVNGSYANIEGITSPDGRILGKMAHVERRGEKVAVNICGEQDMKIFESGVSYFS